MAPPRRASKRTGGELAEPQSKKPRGSKKQTSAPPDNKKTQKKTSTSKSKGTISHQENEVIEVDIEPQGPKTTLRKVKKSSGMSLGFADGDVYIKIGAHKKYHYQLHSSILKRASLRFQRSLSDRPKELSEDLASYFFHDSNISARYEMEFENDFSMGHLVRVVSLSYPSSVCIAKCTLPPS